MKRSLFHGTRQILQFNWPFFAALGVIFGAAKWVLRVRPWPRAVSQFANAGFAVGGFWSVASIAASAWIYDFSPLMKWRWIDDLLEDKPARWANFHAGLDESTPALQEILGGEGQAFDFFNAQIMTEPSIRRARALYTPQIAPTPVDFRALPLQSGALDAAFVLLAAHELRTYKAREEFFAELFRLLAPGGVLILAEHTRNFANFAAFGPGAFHFFPASEWETLGAHFERERSFQITPFVTVWAWRKPR